MVESEFDERDIALVAIKIRDAFYRHKTRARGGKPYKPSPRHDKTEYWEAAAAQVLRLKADPEAYIAAAFTYCRMAASGPFANTLAGQAARQWWREHCNAHGIETDKDGIRITKKTDLGEEDLQPNDDNSLTFMESTASQDIKFDIGIAQMIMQNLSGTPVHTDPLNQALLKQQVIPFPIVARVLLGYPDPEACRPCAGEFLDLFLVRRDFQQAAAELRYPIKEIIEWLRQ